FPHSIIHVLIFLFFHRYAPTLLLHSFPTRRSSDLGQFVAMKTAGRWVDDMVIKAPAAMKLALGENPKSVYNERHETPVTRMASRSEEHTSELQSRFDLVCRLLLDKQKAPK